LTVTERSADILCVHEQPGYVELGRHRVVRRQSRSGVAVLSTGGPSLIRFYSSLVALVLGLSATTVGIAKQISDTPTDDLLGPLSVAPRFHAPFSARATTIVLQRTQDGPLERTTTARYYRDSNGRVRIEYTPVVQSGQSSPIAVVVPNPYAPKERLFMIDEAAKTIELTDYEFFRRFFFGPRVFSIPTAPKRFTSFPTLDVGNGPGSLEDLGNRTIEGLAVTGKRLSDSVRVTERWESSTLGLVIQGHHTDGSVHIEYFLSNVQRTEPPARLFVLPPAYRYVAEWKLGFEGAEAELRRLKTQ
jgi:hypothetical protein